jgi:hypothetical protein
VLLNRWLPLIRFAGNRELDNITIQQDKKIELRWLLSMRQWLKVDQLRATR